MKFQEIIYFFILLAGILAGVLKYKRLQTPGRVLFYLIVFIFLKEASARYLGKVLGKNLFFYQYLSSVDFILLTIIFLSLPLLKKTQLILGIIGLLVLTFYFFNLIIWQPPGSGIDSNFKLLRSFFLVLFSLILFYKLANSSNEESIFNNSQFWFASGVLFFYIISIFYWGVFNYYLGSKNLILSKSVRPFFEIANYLMYSFFAIAIWINKFLVLNGKITR